ncbi:hypothetical protein DBW36_001736 [Escherichia coli]|nr:hypothetical protein [Escherichia coli]EGI3080551.1 hypothetical protein [Escherichia coli]EHD1141012.1 hypothetical protein [Escherichia coli]HAW0765698.1 hypothetical protein [Escherichia coli]HAW3722080.1 hypothetical protein [Escherichia coli]
MFPAPAGINRRCQHVRATTERVPRASGDKPRAVLVGGAELECSPRQRG